MAPQQLPMANVMELSPLILSEQTLFKRPDCLVHLSRQHFLPSQEEQEKGSVWMFPESVVQYLGHSLLVPFTETENVFHVGLIGEYDEYGERASKPLGLLGAMVELPYPLLVIATEANEFQKLDDTPRQVG